MVKKWKTNHKPLTYRARVRVRSLLASFKTIA
jgi:hypothetical protein